MRQRGQNEFLSLPTIKNPYFYVIIILKKNIKIKKLKY